MIIASPTAPSVAPSNKADANASAGPATTRTGAPDAVDPTTDTATRPGEGFGRLLAQRLDDGSARDVAKPDDAATVPTNGKVLFGADGQPLATTNRLPVAEAAAESAADAAPAGTTVRPTIAASTGTAKSAQDDPALPERKDGDDAAGNDLAAQLALVSQWAASPPAPPATVAADPDHDGLDTNDRDPLRGTASTGASMPTPRVPLAVEGLQAAVAPGVGPVVASTVQQTFDRALRGASTTTSSVTKASDLKAKDDAQAVAAGDRLSLAEAILGKPDPATVHGAIDATSMASAFVTSVTAQASNAQTAAAAAATPTPSQLHEPIGTTAWSHEVGQATLRMAANDLQTASLRLNPEHLGPLDVQVRVDNGVAHLAFNAAHAETRQALESSRTTLDQLFADQGLKIGDCAVGDSSAQRRFDADAMQGGASGEGRRRDSAGSDAGDASTSTVTTTVRRALGLVDTFA